MSSSGLSIQSRDVSLAMTALAGGAAPSAAANTLASTSEITVVATTGDSVILPAAQVMGAIFYVANRDAADDADVFPPTGGTINGGTTTTGQVRIPTTQGGIFACASADGLTWLAVLTAACAAS